MSEFGPLEWLTIGLGALAAVVAVGIAVTDWWVLRQDREQRKGWQ